MKTTWAAALLALAALQALPVSAYPLDGYGDTGIRRLEASRLADEGKLADAKQPPGAHLKRAEVDLRLLGQSFDLPPVDEAFTRPC